MCCGNESIRRLFRFLTAHCPFPTALFYPFYPQPRCRNFLTTGKIVVVCP